MLSHYSAKKAIWWDFGITYKSDDELKKEVEALLTILSQVLTTEDNKPLDLYQQSLYYVKDKSNTITFTLFATYDDYGKKIKRITLEVFTTPDEVFGKVIEAVEPINKL